MGSKPSKRSSNRPSTSFSWTSTCPGWMVSDFSQELRRQQMPQPPAIMVSTGSAARDQIAAYRAGASCFLLKPVRLCNCWPMPG